jgi:hypothetical protein
MDDMMGAIGWVIAIVSMIAIIVLVGKKKINKDDVKVLLDAFLATKAVKELEDKAWKEIKIAVKDKLEGTAVWDIFKEWFASDDSTDTKKTEVKDKKKKTKTDDEDKEIKEKEEKKVEVKDEDEEKSDKKDEEE